MKTVTSVVAVVLLVAVFAVNQASARICPDNRMKCLDKNTCCKMPGKDTGYGCCPFTNAMCCSDHIHCCPEHSKCDVKARACVAGSKNLQPRLQMLQRLIHRMKGQATVVPMAEIVPLTDSESNSVVEEPKQASLHTAATLTAEGPGGQSLLAVMYNSTVDDKLVLTPCPDGSACPSRYTCCMLSNRHYGCCPYDKGVCCSDHATCCPAGTRCAGGGCQ